MELCLAPGTAASVTRRDSWSVGLLVWVMDSSATVALVRQAKERSLDLQLVGDLSGRRGRVMVVGVLVVRVRGRWRASSWVETAGYVQSKTWNGMRQEEDLSVEGR